MRAVNRNYIKTFLLGMAVVLLPSCSDEEEPTTDYKIVSGEATGCLQGVVYDGVNGERVDLAAADMYVVTYDKVVAGLKSATSLSGANDERTAELTGEYVLCDIPFGGQQVPLYLNMDGYQPFTQIVTLPTRTPNRGNTTTTPGFWVWPTLLNDITVFKLSDLVANDYTVKVFKAGSVIEGATVALVPNNVRMTSVRATTDASGVATFAAASLAFGQTYDLQVYDATPDVATGGNATVYGSVQNITIGSLQGVVAPVVAESVFSISVDVGIANAAPVLVTQTPDNSAIAAAAVKFTFDRAVKPHWGSLQAATAAISDYGTKTDGTACTNADLGEVIGTPQISVAVAENVATVTPNWTTAPTTTGCKGVQVTYTWNGFGFVTASATDASMTGVGANKTIYLTSPE